MSTIEVNKITPVSGGTTVQVGESGDTINIPAGATIANAGTSTGFGATLTGSTNNTVVTVTGANAMQGEANLTYDGSTLIVKPSSNTSQLKLEQNNATDNWGIFCDSGGGILKLQRFTGGATTTPIEVTSSGLLGIGTSGHFTPTQRLNVYGSHISEAGLVRIQTSNGSGDAAIVKFIDGNSDTCGEISLNAGGNSVAYGTSSDYRLKENEVAISDGITRLKTLKPYKFNFKSQPEKTVDGFFAHEVSSVVPEAISGEKDGDKMQSIDQSKLVPLLTSALQEAITKIETLEARVQTLENA